MEDDNADLLQNLFCNITKFPSTPSKFNLRDVRKSLIYNFQEILKIIFSYLDVTLVPVLRDLLGHEVGLQLSGLVGVDTGSGLVLGCPC